MRLGALLIGVLLLACTTSPAPHERADARAVADAYMKSKSMFDPRMPVKVEDAGTQWLVTYSIPKGAIGDGHRVWVDKRRMEVVASVGSQ